ncbi:hypothetical protein M9435_003651 [Picochlorum sp. BPE23]|nr:hypothetical protein M9435_003651 [Picochlorum sp. BPE23]
MQDPVKAKSFPPKAWLVVSEIICALIVLGTSAAVIDQWYSWKSCTPTPNNTDCLNNFRVAWTNSQGLINIALFTSILGLLLSAAILMAYVGADPEEKLIVVAEFVMFVLLWIFWFTSIICTTILADNTKWSLVQACCAFSWFSWFAVTASLVLSIIPILRSSRKQRASGSRDPSQEMTPQQVA